MSGFRAIPLLDDARPRRIAELLFVVWSLGAVDLLLTVWAHYFTPFHELNPFARQFLQTNAIPSLVLYKFAMTAIGTGIFWAYRHRRTTELAVWLVAAAYVLLSIQWSSYTQDAMASLASAPWAHT